MLKTNIYLCFLQVILYHYLLLQCLLGKINNKQVLGSESLIHHNIPSRNLGTDLNVLIKIFELRHLYIYFSYFIDLDYNFLNKLIF